MSDADIQTLICLIWNDSFARLTFLLIIIFTSLLCFSFSFLYGLLAFAAFVSGFVAFNAIFKYCSEVPCIFSLLLKKTNVVRCISLKTKQCKICGGERCKRHPPSRHVSQPWLGLDIPEELDDAIADLLNKILNEFVYSWYHNVSRDEGFVQELRFGLRHACSIFILRALQLDVSHVIINKLIPAGINHLDDYLGSVRLSEKLGVTLERASVQYLSNRLHPATRNRANELQYLRHMATLVLPELLPTSQLKCRNSSVFLREILSGWVLLPMSDALADPNIINSLLILLFGKHNLTQYPDKPLPRVEFLSRFISSVPPSSCSALHSDVAGMLKEQDLLYSFMQFLKGEGLVHVLQFCLDVEEFNRKMLNPDLSKADLENLYREAWDLFSVYFKQDSPDKINFNYKIVNEVHKVLQEPSENIVKLRTSTPLFQAYEYAYSILENELGPLYHHSDDYYTLLCGSRIPSGFNKSGSRINRKLNEVSTVTRLSNKLNKIKGALMSDPVDGQTYDRETGLDLGESEFNEDLPDDSSAYRDLSAWRVSIPSIETKCDYSNKSSPVFVIDVQRIDVSSEDDPELCHWTVDRKYNDFYTLESKLAEFHGEFSDVQLPPKRLLFGPKGLEFLESRRQVFEEYIQRLLQKSTLRRSDLLHSFLHSPSEFVPAGTGGLAGAVVPEGLGRMIRRTVPLKLRKEKGQHLDPFLNMFIASTETNKNKSGKYEWKDIHVEIPRNIRCLTNSIFEDNFGLSSSLQFPIVPVPVSVSCSVHIQGIFDCFLYLAVRVFNAPLYFVRLALSLKSVFGNTAHTIMNLYLDNKLKNLLVTPRLAYLVKLLQGAIFNPRTPHPNSEELKARARKAREHMYGILPQYVCRWFHSNYKDGLNTVFEAIQSPQLNKQLMYTLLDIVVADLFPELATSKMSPQPL